MYGNIVAIHNIFLKNYIAKFSTSSIFKKISKYNFEKKIKKKRSQFWGKKEKTNVKKKAKKKERKHVGKAKHLQLNMKKKSKNNHFGKKNHIEKHCNNS